MDYNSTRFLPLYVKDIWTPDIALLNTINKFEIITRAVDRSIAWAAYDGHVYYAIGGVLGTSCDPDISHFPFDVHECYLQFVPHQNIFFAGKMINSSIFQIAEPEVGLSEIDEDGKWDYHALKPCVVNIENRQLFAATFPIVIKRRWAFVFVNIIVPLLLLGYLNVMVYLIPLEAGERISFAITVLLSYTVFMIVMVGKTPDTSHPMPMLSFFLIFKLICSALISVSVIIISHFFHHDGSATPPKMYQKIARDIEDIQMTVCCERTKNEGEENMNIKSLGHELIVEDNNETHVISTPLHTANDNRVSQRDWKTVCRAIDKVLLVIFLFITMIETVVFFFILLRFDGKHLDTDRQNPEVCADYN